VTDPTTEFERMELLGEDTMRAKLARGELTGEQARDAEIFVGMKQMERKAFSEVALQYAREQAASGRTSNRIAFAALVISLVAAAVAVTAFVMR
jgi:hypothetical protein